MTTALAQQSTWNRDPHTAHHVISIWILFWQFEIRRYARLTDAIQQNMSSYTLAS